MDAKEKAQGRKVVALLRQLSRETFGIDIDQVAGERGHEFWALGIDSKKKRYVDILNNIDAKTRGYLNTPTVFIDSDAGFRVSAQASLSLGEKRADIFLVNKDHFGKSEQFLVPLLCHELCHFVEQLGKAADFECQATDETNATVILESFTPQVRALHSPTWAKLMARTARQAAQGGSVTSVRTYLERAIPLYDRPAWNGELVQEP